MNEAPPIEWGLIVAFIAIGGAVLILLVLAATGGDIAY